MPLLRKIVFYIFLAVYGVVCPLLILRMLGFIFAPQTGFVKTGLIYVSANPPNAKVIIDGVAAHETAPTVIRDLTPGEHDIAINLQGYVPWRKKVPVAGNKATALDNVLLVPAAWRTRTLTDTDFNTLIALAGNPPSLIAGRGDTIDDIILMRLNKNIEEEEDAQVQQPLNGLPTLFPAQSIYKGARVMGYFTVDKSPFFVIHIVDDNKDKYLWVDPREKQPHAEDITELLIGEPKQLTWEASDEKNIFALQGTTVNRLNIKSRAIYPGIMENTQALGVMDNTVFGLTLNGLLIHCDYDGQNKKATVPPTRDLIVLATQNPDFLPAAMRYLGITADARGIMPGHERSLALIWTKNRVGILDYSQTSADERPASVQWIYSRGQNIAQAFWANNDDNILVRDDGGILLLDKENFGQPRLTRVADVNGDSMVYYTDKTGQLYYLTPGTRRLSWIQIVHHKPFIPAPIAESLLIKKLEH
jgi:hypothetical protein